MARKHYSLEYREQIVALVKSRRPITRLMLQQGLRGVCRRRRKGRSKRTGTVVLAPDQVRRSFQAERPNQLWVADATYIPTSEGTLYLAAIQDVFSRRVVGWSMSPNQDAELMVRALQMAVRTRHPRKSFIIPIMVRNIRRKSFDKHAPRRT